MESQEEVFCKICDRRKEGRFCNNCRKNTPSLFKQVLSDSLCVEELKEGSVQRGEQSVGHIINIATVVLGVILAIVPLSEVDLFFKILSIVAIAVLMGMICVFGDVTRNLIIGYVSKVKSHREKF